MGKKKLPWIAINFYLREKRLRGGAVNVLPAFPLLGMPMHDIVGMTLLRVV